MAFPSLQTWSKGNISFVSRLLRSTRPTPSTLRTPPAALSSTRLASKSKLPEAGVAHCHLVSLSRGNTRVVPVLMIVLIYPPPHTSAYTDTTPGIKWNVSDRPTSSKRTCTSQSVLDLRQSHRSGDLPHPRPYRRQLVDAVRQ